ncbi:MAG: cobalt ECF transporter T component CbiQ [Candidatus Eisenbacteria bacterium]|uniref:Cobalt ECF transporter T component CbiQ n=1 Tax=Eiseniibacteriota bacterium TaxID=2212470 RepID=A0A956NF91_UNCEI|nr:cobalt ECF transporter T component CbiQ [Candidatus Eisenbacteria bacterium]
MKAGELFASSADLDSPVHRLPAAMKLWIAVAMVVLVALAPKAWWFVPWGAALFLALVSGLSRVPARVLVGRLLIVEPFVLGVAILSLFQENGVSIFLALLAKSTVCIYTMVLLSCTTPFTAWIDALRQARVPSIFVTTVALMYRYLYVLLDEALRMRRARAARSFAPSRRFDWRLLASVAGQLFLRSTARAERIYSAMLSRGWR